MDLIRALVTSPARIAEAVVLKCSNNVLVIFTLTTLVYFHIDHREQRVSILNYHKCLIWPFPLHLNTYVLGLRPLKIFNSFSAGIDFRRQNLTSKIKVHDLSEWSAIYQYIQNTCDVCQNSSLVAWLTRRLGVPLRPISFFGAHICSDPNCSNSWDNNDNRTHNRFAPHKKRRKK